MKHLPLTFLSLLSLILFIGCASNERFEMGGIPKWVAGGTKISGEPEPMQPDPAIIPFARESGPVRFTYITDKRQYDDPPEKKAKKPSTSDPLERGRDYRIKRLFR